MTHLLLAAAVFVAAGCGGDASIAPRDAGGDAPVRDVALDAPTDTAPPAYRSYAVLGDFMSDRGIEGPFFYDLLVHNDDARWPDFAGSDLTARFGSSLQVVKVSSGHARAASLAAQIGRLPEGVSASMLVTITVGLEDVVNSLAVYLPTGGASEDQAAFRRDVGAALDKLTKSGHFGPAASRILLTNIYDPSEGTGDFSYDGIRCAGSLGVYPAGRPTGPLFEPWNAILSEEAARHPEVRLVDLHAHFMGHGLARPPAERWIGSDCSFPNALGHDQVRRLMWRALLAR